MTVPSDVHANTTPKKSLRLNTIIVMVGTLGSRLSGIVRQQILGLFDNALLDAFNVAVRIPNLLRELLAEGALVNSFIPVYKSLNAAERQQLARSFSGMLIGINLLLMALGIFGAPWIIDLLLAQESNVDRALAVYMGQLVMPFLMLISLSTIAMGILNANEHFKESSFAPIAFNIASIVALLLLPHTATWLAFGWLIGGIAQLVVQLPALSRFGLLPGPSLQPHPAVKRVFKQMAPFTLTAGARQFLNLYVTRQLSNQNMFGAGTQAGYGFAEAIFTTVNGLFVVSPALAVLPRFAQHAAEGQWPEFRKLTMQVLKTTTFMAAPMSALLFVLPGHAASILNLQTNFDTARFAATSSILQGWALALIPWALVTILLRTFYARERTRDAVVISAIGFVVEVGLYHLLVPELKLFGFGLSTALSGTLMSIALISMYRKHLWFPVRDLLKHLRKVIFLAVLTGASAFLVSQFLPAPGHIIPGLFSLAIASIVGLAVYFGGALWMRMPELSGVLKRFKK